MWSAAVLGQFQARFMFPQSYHVYTALALFSSVFLGLQPLRWVPESPSWHTGLAGTPRHRQAPVPGACRTVAGWVALCEPHGEGPASAPA